jgi:hypothetical protein
VLLVVSRNFIVRLVGPLGRNYLSIAGAGRLSNLQYSRYCFPDRTMAIEKLNGCICADDQQQSHEIASRTCRYGDIHWY